jgi:hypothetical protein
MLAHIFWKRSATLNPKSLAFEEIVQAMKEEWRRRNYAW